MAPALRNPYLNRSMIRSVEEFHGRRREVARLLSRMGARTPQSVSLVGERRMGKSSLLWHVAQPQVCAGHLAEPERYIFLYLDFQGHQYLDQGGFCRVFGEQLNAAAGGRICVGTPADLSGIEAAAQGVDRAGLQLVCLLDEFETVTRNAAFGPEFYGALRSLANGYNVAYVTASRQHLQSLCHNQEISESPFFNIFAEVRVGAMPDSEVAELIEGPSAAAGLPLVAHAAAIRHLGGNLPFFVQIACSSAFECLQDAGGQGLDEARLERVFLEEAESHFQYLWGVFGEGERRALVELAEGGTAAGEVVAGLEEAGYVTVREDAPRVFSEAFARFVLEEAGRGRAAEPGAGPQAAPSPLPPAGEGGLVEGHRGLPEGRPGRTGDSHPGPGFLAVAGRPRRPSGPRPGPLPAGGGRPRPAGDPPLPAGRRRRGAAVAPRPQRRGRRRGHGEPR
ncbi:MAG: ATP-binding protein [Gemmatimonadota bacterium]